MKKLSEFIDKHFNKIIIAELLFLTAVFLPIILK